MLGKYTDLVVKVDGMTCGHCKARIEKDLREIKGVKADVDLEEKKVNIRYKENKVSVEDIKKVITDAGYEVVGVE